MRKLVVEVLVAFVIGAVVVWILAHNRPLLRAGSTLLEHTQYSARPLCGARDNVRG